MITIEKKRQFLRFVCLFGFSIFSLAAGNRLGIHTFVQGYCERISLGSSSKIESIKAHGGDGGEYNPIPQKICIKTRRFIIAFAEAGKSRRLSRLPLKINRFQRRLSCESLFGMKNSNANETHSESGRRSVSVAPIECN